MKILAVEFASPQRSVALADTDANTRCRFASSEVIETGARSTHAFKMIEEALGQARVEREQVDCLAIGLGPGSYTGIRIAIAIAQGWQLACDVKLLGISTVECIAAQAGIEGLLGRVAVVIDAQRGEFYLSVFDVGAESNNEVEPLRLVSSDKVEECQKAGHLLVGPEVTKWFANGRVVFPRAATLGQLAAGRTSFVAGEKLEPIYLRETAFVKAPLPRKPAG
jgi:tRNA threonylcarbamoyl adenosine modification protein YeaZ